GQRYYFEDDGKWVESNEADLLKTVGNNNQLILVTTNDYGTNRAKIKTFDKRNNKWYQVSSEDGYLGKQGFAHEMSEYVNASPRGKYTIGTAFGRYDNPGTKLPYRKITSNDVWVDDSNSQYYNTWQQKPVNGRWNSAENMNVSAYDYGFAINYNTERTPHKGSAIFFHVSDSWTAGCTGVSKQNVVNTLKWLDPSKNPVIVQTPESELGYY
ncbi:L,D-transpeptidase family protein, partial [Bacillus cereus]|uniref:L,D-transpeptidase family protein n=1 Tax=Bacillus cereus TaxID=1396 RepID=UPI003D1818B9